ncbi:hypothetical protein [Nannocystis punicea]|uniref:Uncharacterized protein n=1 Tax=Nannocystis punicea TaxID=2995304 RepID=A0ABY7GRI7_9BACT|nr:hypothetical protein [Nannocystis poenicansa]WAS89576.1 hypothetical protein O0S08_25560 [Nannocystis poenicansa]
MSAYDVVFSNPSLDPNHPAQGPVFVNASPRDFVVVLSVELTRDPQQPDARAILHGIDSSEKGQQHVIGFAAPATAYRTTVAVRLAAMEDGKPRPLAVEVATPGAVCTVRVLSATPL